MTTTMFWLLALSMAQPLSLPQPPCLYINTCSSIDCSVITHTSRRYNLMQGATNDSVSYQQNIDIALYNVRSTINGIRYYINLCDCNDITCAIYYCSINGPYNSIVWCETTSPTAQPALLPTFTPTSNPTNAPTPNPTQWPSFSPSRSPTNAPTSNPTDWPTFAPSRSPTHTPTSTPTLWPTLGPTHTTMSLPLTPPPSAVASITIEQKSGVDPSMVIGVLVACTLLVGVGFAYFRWRSKEEKVHIQEDPVSEIFRRHSKEENVSVQEDPVYEIPFEMITRRRGIPEDIDELPDHYSSPEAFYDNAT